VILDRNAKAPRIRRIALGLLGGGLLMQIFSTLALARSTALPLMVRGGLVAVIGAFNLVFLARRMRRLSWRVPFSPLADTPFFVWWFTSLFFLPFGVGLWTARLLGVRVSPTLDGLLLGAVFVFAGLEVLTGHLRTRTREVEVPLAGLPAELDGYRIVQLSDLHVSDQLPAERAGAWVEAANALSPDLVALTGDYIASGTEYHGAVAQLFSRLRARDGVLAVMGNHDYFGDGEAFVTALQTRGVRVLRNEGLRLGRGTGGLYVAGVDDTWSGRDDLPRTLADRPDGVPVVLLAHDPDVFHEAKEAGVDLQLSGHTHGGQVAFPGLARWVNLAWLMSGYVAGLYRAGDARLYVHRGLGTTGLPLRVAVPPELAVLTLRSA
jgi:predicted MPP superfamily phosphohydrolase